MKKVLAIIAVVILMMGKGNAQITLEHVLDSTSFGTFYCTDLGNNDFKYISMHYATNSFDILNMDLTPYIPNIQLPFGDSVGKGFCVTYVTKSLFDCDSANVEYVYQNSIDAPIHPFRILRTDGTLLFKLDSAQGPFYYAGIFGGAIDIRPIFNSSTGTKLFLQKYDSNHEPEALIYGLCGVLPAQVFDFSQHGTYIKIFPNPTSSTLTFEINPPDNMNEYELVVVDGNAKEVKREKVGGWNRSYTMDVKDLAGGSYFYSLCTKDRAFGNGKFVINK